mgnify:CR=1 FL=1
MCIRDRASLRARFPEAAPLSVNELLHWPGMLADDSLGFDEMLPHICALTDAALAELVAKPNLFSPLHRNARLPVRPFVRQGRFVRPRAMKRAADALAGALAGFKDNKLDASFVEKFDRAKPDFSTLAPSVAKQNPQAVLIFGTGSAVVDGIKVMRAAGVTGQIVTLSNNASGGFVKALGSASRGVVVTQVFPSERAVTFPLVREATALAQQAKVELTPAMVEGYTNAKVLVEGLRRAGPNPTRASLHNALETFKKFDLGGLTLSYTAEDHSGLDFSDLSIIGPDGYFRR